jgi:hypothetical protein
VQRLCRNHANFKTFLKDSLGVYSLSVKDLFTFALEATSSRNKI